MLPYKALNLIREYSKPLTRPDWHTFERSITTNIFINEIDTLYKFERNCSLYKLVHTNMHVNIDLCLYDMTQEELDAFINYPPVVFGHFNNFVYIAMHVEFVWFLYLLVFDLLHLQYYFINYQDNTIIINNVIIYFGGLYASYCIGYKLAKLYLRIMTRIMTKIFDRFDSFISFWK
jgi:hypothetical protein